MENKVYKVDCRFICIQTYILNNNINKIKYFNNKYTLFHFENYNSHVFESLFIFKVMIALNREILVNLIKNMVILNGIN